VSRPTCRDRESRTVSSRRRGERDAADPPEARVRFCLRGPRRTRRANVVLVGRSRTHGCLVVAFVTEPIRPAPGPRACAQLCGPRACTGGVTLRPTRVGCVSERPWPAWRRPVQPRPGPRRRRRRWAMFTWRKVYGPRS
jgi:hypothetical protein